MFEGIGAGTLAWRTVSRHDGRLRTGRRGGVLYALVWKKGLDMVGV